MTIPCRYEACAVGDRGEGEEVLEQSVDAYAEASW